MTEKKFPVSERALMARINRKLAKECKRLHKSRSASMWYDDLGPYHIVDDVRNQLERTHIDDLESLAKEFGVIAKWEQLESMTED